MNWVLGIDTSSVDMGLGLYNGASPVASYSRYVKNSHAEHIAQAVSHMLSINNVPSVNIHRIAITVGPGSFTGLRIGIAFAKGFSIATGIRICPVSSLLVLAHTARLHTGSVVAALDARNGNVFWASFSFENGVIKRITDDMCSPVEDFSNAIQTESAVVTDTMGYVKSSAFNFLDNRPNTFPVERYPIQRGFFCAATGAALLENNDVWIDSSDLQPHYLRSSSACVPGVKA